MKTKSNMTDNREIKYKNMDTLESILKSMFTRRGFGKRIVIPLITINGSKNEIIYELDDVVKAIINIYE
jgi:hypothetical protein